MASPEPFKSLKTVRNTPFARFPEANIRGISSRDSLGNRMRLDRETLSTILAAAFQYFLPRRSAIAGTKTVGLRALTLFRLVGSFWHGKKVTR